MQDDLKQTAELERLMTAANVYRRRGDYALARQSIEKALAIDQANPEVREFAADLLLAAGKLEEAADEYKRIFEVDPSRTSAEQKYATAILQIAEGKRQRDLLREMVDRPGKPGIPPRSPGFAALLSLAPGFGHAYCGQVVKGVILFVGTMLCWFLFYQFSPNMADYEGLGSRVRETVSATAYFFRNLSASALLFACVAAFLHIYALIDAPVVAGKLRDQARGLEAPAAGADK